MTTPTAPTWARSANIAGPPGGFTLPRARATITTPALATNESVQTVIRADQGIRLYRVALDRLARVRMYGTTAAQTADVARPATTQPVPTDGVMLDFVADQLDTILAPGVEVMSLADPATADLPITVTNLGAAGTVTVQLYYIPTERPGAIAQQVNFVAPFLFGGT